MIKNEVKQFSYVFSSDSDFSISSSSVVVYKPDGSTVPGVTLSINPGTNSPTQSVFTSSVQIDTVGQWLVAFYLSIGSETIIQTERYFATYSSLYSKIRETSAVDSTIASDSMLDSLIAVQIKLLENNYPDFKYANVSFSDGLVVDLALEYLVSIPVYQDNPRQQPSGEITKIKLDSDEFSFSVPVSAGKSNVADWESIAIDLLSSLSCFSSINSVRNTASIVVSSRRDSDRTLLGTSNEPLYNLYYDDVIDWELTRKNV